MYMWYVCTENIWLCSGFGGKLRQVLALRLRLLAYGGCCSYEVQCGGGGGGT